MSATNWSRLALLVLYVRARDAPFARRSRAQAAPMLVLFHELMIMYIGRYLSVLTLLKLL